MKHAKGLLQELAEGALVRAGDERLAEMHAACAETRELLRGINAGEFAGESSSALLGRLTGREVPDSVQVFFPIYMNYGRNIDVGPGVFINFGVTLLGLGNITIGEGVLIGPNVTIATEGHGVAAGERHDLITMPVTIGANAWLGAGCTILPGVTVGENAIVAAGAVVNKDVAPNTVVGGVPAKILKEIREGDDRKS